jgi:hypothetical protein
MKTSLLLSLLAAALIGCENLHQQIRSSSLEGRAAPGQPPILVGNHEFASLDALEAYVRTLPPGAALAWDKSSLGTDLVPLPNATITVNQFGDYCRNAGVDFRINVAYERQTGSRTYDLRDSGFKTFCQLIDRPPVPPDEARQLFAACGVPYAPDLLTFFKDAGVPIPPQTAVLYDWKGDRLIVTTMHENESAFGRIIWSYETRAFDQKMRCLTARLKPQRPGS